MNRRQPVNNPFLNNKQQRKSLETIAQTNFEYLD